MAQAARGEEGAEVKRDEGKQTTQPDPAAVRAAEVWWRVGTRLVGHKPYHSNVRVLVIPDPEPK